MIDDKLIEQAASECVARHSAVKRILPNGAKITQKPHNGIEIYKEAVHWAISEFLKGLWHPASEVPKMGAEILAEAAITDSIKTYLSFKRSDALFKDWAAYCRGARVIRWLYIDNLIKKGVEESTRYEKGKMFVDSQNFNKLNYLAKVLLSAQNETQREYCYLLSDRKTDMSGKKVAPLNYDFGTAIKFLKAGGAIRRSGWNGKGLFVIKQVPAYITGDIIPNMQSLPQSAKDLLMKRENPHIDYTNQMLIINPDGRADSWVPSSSDVFAEDWEIVTD